MLPFNSNGDGFMMKFTDIFIRRPVLALVISFVIIIAGLQAVRSLNVRQYPRSENATITVSTVYIGASAHLVRGFITTPLERVIAAADGIDYIESQSAYSLSTIKVRLKLNYDATKALAEISSKVDQVRNDLPPESEIPTLNIESADSEFASAYLSFSSDTLLQNEITDYLVRVVQPRLSAIEGVQRADILGARTFAMRIWLDPERMAAFNISPVQVHQALSSNNFLSALGQTKGSLIQVNLTANTDLKSVEEFKRLSSVSRMELLFVSKILQRWFWAQRITILRFAFQGKPPCLWEFGHYQTPTLWMLSSGYGLRWQPFKRGFPVVWRHVSLTMPLRISIVLSMRFLRHWEKHC